MEIIHETLHAHADKWRNEHRKSETTGKMKLEYLTIHE